MRSGEEWSELEDAARELARRAGAAIVGALERSFAVRYKTPASRGRTASNPVSEVDLEVEELLRGEIGRRFPEHAILGEELGLVEPRGAELAWAIDPIDGTTNFVHGFPLFAASIGVVHRGIPVAGAVWCSTGHALRPGVYHAARGSAAPRFDGEPLPPRPSRPELARHLLGRTGGAERPRAPFDLRATGSAAIECAFVAAGLLRAARFKPLHAWDVAGGVPLLWAAGHEVHVESDGGWRPFARFEPSAASWRRSLLVGPRAACEALRDEAQ